MSTHGRDLGIGVEAGGGRASVRPGAGGSLPKSHMHSMLSPWKMLTSPAVESGRMDQLFEEGWCEPNGQALGAKEAGGS